MSDNESPSFLPRPGDLPRKELLALAKRTVQQNGGLDKVSVFFKYTCQWCGKRNVFAVPNTLYEVGVCGTCGKETEVGMGGMRVEFKV